MLGFVSPKEPQYIRINVSISALVAVIVGDHQIRAATNDSFNY